MKLTLNKKDFINALKVAVLAAGKNDVRYYLNGIHIEACAGDEVNIVATDGHMIARVTLEAPVAEPHCYTIARAAVEQLIKSTVVARDRSPNEITETIDLNYTPAEMLNTQDGANVSHHELIDGRFPDYHRVLYGKTDGTGDAVQTIGIEIDCMTNALKAAKLIGANKTFTLEFNNTNGLIVVRPATIRSVSQIKDVVIGVMPSRVF